MTNEDSQNGSTCGTIYYLASVAFSILSIVWFNDIVLKNHGQNGPEYSYIISWMYKIGVYCSIQLSFTIVTIFILVVSVMIESPGLFFGYIMLHGIGSYCVSIWLLVDGVAVRNTFDYPCTHMSEFNITAHDMMSGNATQVCDLYNGNFNVLFIFFVVLFSMMTLCCIVLCCFGGVASAMYGESDR